MSWAHAAIAARSVSRSPLHRPVRHCRVIALSSFSALGSQLPCPLRIERSVEGSERVSIEIVQHQGHLLAVACSALPAGWTLPAPSLSSCAARGRSPAAGARRSPEPAPAALPLGVRTARPCRSPGAAGPAGDHRSSARPPCGPRTPRFFEMESLHTASCTAE